MRPIVERVLGRSNRRNSAGCAQIVGDFSDTTASYTSRISAETDFPDTRLAGALGHRLSKDCSLCGNTAIRIVDCSLILRMSRRVRK